MIKTLDNMQYFRELQKYLLDAKLSGKTMSLMVSKDMNIVAHFEIESIKEDVNEIIFESISYQYSVPITAIIQIDTNHSFITGKNRDIIIQEILVKVQL